MEEENVKLGLKYLDELDNQAELWRPKSWTNKEENEKAIREKKINRLLDTNGASPLHVALHPVNVSNFSMEKIKYLVQNKCDVNSKDKHGMTPLILAAINQKVRLELISFLFENKAELNLCNPQNQNALLFASMNDSVTLEMIKYMVENKSDVNLKDTEKNSPLHYSTEKKNPSLEIISYLIQNKAEINNKNKWNTSPIELASCNQQLKTQIQEAGSDSIQNYFNQFQNN